jgi:integrase
VAGLNKLTAAFVKASSEPGVYRDGQGLELRVKSSSSKNWVMVTRYNGKRPEIGLGSALNVTLAQARQKRDKILAVKREGGDPRLALSGATRNSGAITFDEAAALVIEMKAPAWKSAKQRPQWESSLACYASPIIGHLPVDQITIDHIESIMAPIWLTKTETASRVRSRVETILAWAIVKKHRDHPNPAIWSNNLEFLLPAKNKVSRVKHFAALPYVEMPGFMAGLVERDSLSARALEFLILTTGRSGEVMAARWDEIENNTWTLTEDRMKAGRVHRVPLVPRAQQILQSLPRVNDYIFPGTRGHISNNTMRKYLQEDLSRPDATPHGFRSTFKDWAVECTAFEGDVSEAQLAHMIKNAAQAAYERGDKLQKRLDLLLEWEAFCYGNQAPI